jgi:hypothetical protein
MLKTWMTAAAAALGVLLVGSVDMAEAGKRGGWSGGGGGAKFYGARMHSGPKFSGGAKWQGAPRIYAGPKYSGGYKNSYKNGGYGYKHGGKPYKFAHRHKYRFVGVPLAYYGYSNYAYLDNSCYWLRRRALDTGNSYWWDRYYACIDGYDAY